MRIVSWNCHGAFRRKLEALEPYKADLYIIQECENPALSEDANYKQWASNYLWVGSSKNKGLGVFTSDANTLAKFDLGLNHASGELRWFIPFRFNDHLNMVAVWTQATPTGEYRYIGQFYLLLKDNLSRLKNAVIIGDFNSNKIWDYKRRGQGHTECVQILKSLNTHSLYHELTLDEQGSEKAATFYLQKNPVKKYHIDYAFVPEVFLGRSKLQIGLIDEWLTLSDHMPLFIDLG